MKLECTDFITLRLSESSVRPTFSIKKKYFNKNSTCGAGYIFFMNKKNLGSYDSND